MVKFKEQFVSEHVVNSRSYGYGNPVDYVIIHQTGNVNWGADAGMHAKLQSRMNPRLASWHEQVDDEIAIQSFEDGVQCWAATDGRGPGNTRGYHIEICINADGDYKQAVKNGAERARIKLKEHGLGIDRLKQHADFHNKNCPAQIRAGKEGIDWNDFVSMVKDEATIPNDGPEQVIKPSKPANKPNKANLTIDGYFGTATTKALQKALGTTQDGVISGQYRNSVTEAIYSVKFGPKYTGSNVILALQKKIGAKADGYIGKETVRKLQKHLGTLQDGVISQPSLMVKELQKRLNKGTF